MNSTTKRLAPLCLVSALACAASTESPGGVLIETSASTLTLQSTPRGPRLDMSVTLTNTSTNPVVWFSCGFALERNRYVLTSDRGGDDWGEVWTPVCARDNSVAPPPLRSGESVTVPINVPTTAAAHVFPGETGVYRVRFFLAVQMGGEFHQLPYEFSVSKPFTVVSD